MARERGKSTDWPKGLACLKHRDSSMVLPYLRLVFGCGDVPDFFMCGGQTVGFFELFLIGIGLSMDAFAVAICKGLGMERINKRDTLLLALFFGGFQALMPLTGYLLGSRFASYIERWDHWIAFVLLCFIGGSMIRESRSEEDEEEMDASFRPKEMLTMAVATSIDALAVGVSFAFLGMGQGEILSAAGLIAATTFVFSAVGVSVGSVFGSRFKSKAELCGGVILILIGLKILLEHLGILG